MATNLFELFYNLFGTIFKFIGWLFSPIKQFYLLYTNSRKNYFERKKFVKNFNKDKRRRGRINGEL